MKKFRAVFYACIGAGLLFSALPASAQDYEDMSCDELWYARNSIYARNGYCFKTDRARSVFGPGCYPPYGQLRGRDRARVNEIQMWEARYGCD